MFKKVQSLLIILCLFIQTISIPYMAGAAGDVSPPVTSINIKGGLSGISGTYFGYADIELSAADDISGIQSIELSTNGGKSWVHYTSAVRLTTPDTYEIRYRSTDIAGNREIEKSQIIVIKKDDEAPITKSTITGPKGGGNYYSGPVKINLVATDKYSGVKQTEYSTDGGTTWNIYSQPITLSESKTYLVLFHSIDQSGNVEKDNSEVVQIDVTPPTIPMIMFNPTGWTKENLLVSIVDGQDTESGVLKTQYKLGDSGAWIDYINPFNIATNSDKKIFARTMDFAGNISNVVNASVKIDKNSPSAPKILLSYEGWVDDDVYFVIEHGVDNESGVQISQYKVGNEEWQDYLGPEYITIEGQTAVKARTIDRAGNISNESSAVVSIDKTPPAPPKFQPNPTTWSNKDIMLSIINGVDLLSGAKISQYKIGSNETWIDYSSSFIVSQEGENLITARTIDLVDNISKESSIVIKIDKTAPTAPTITPSTTEWTNQNVTFTVKDGVDSLSGVQKSQYKVGVNGTWIDYNSMVTVSTEGINPLFSRTIDVAGNISKEATVTIKIDKTPPTAPTNLFAPSKTAKSVLLSWTPSVDNLSEIIYEIYDGSTLLGTSSQARYNAVNLDPTVTHRFSVKAKDEAKNVSAPSNEITVVISSPLVSAGGTYSAIKSDGKVWVWGNNSGGQLGDGTTTLKTTPSLNSTLTGFISVSSGVNHSVGLKSDGTVWAWGDNLNGGNLADDSLSRSLVPVQIRQLTSIVAISVGLAQSFALQDDGTVWAWGNNQYGQLGDGTKTKANFPVKVTNLDSVVAISNNYIHTMALKSDGTVWTWGNNAQGQLGDGTKIEKLVPTQVLGLNSVIAISAGSSHSMALKRDGTVWGWGDGMVGDGSSSGQTRPVQVTNLNSVTSISAGNMYSVALKNDGSVWTWGYNNLGNLGDGTTVNQAVPVKVSHLGSITSISATDQIAFATMNNGSVWTWGSNSNYGLGNGNQTIVNKTTRIQVTGIPGNYTDTVAPSSPVLSYSGVASNSVVLNWSEASDNFVVESYEVYKGSTLVATQTVDSKTSTDARIFIVTGLSPGTAYSFTVKAKDGSGNVSPSSNVVTVTTTIALPTLSAGGLSESIVLKSDGTVWQWGSYSDAATQVPNLNSIISISETYSHILALRSDGTVWVWGQNRSGQLGDGSGMNKTTPVQIPNLNSVVAVSAGGSHSLVLKSDGTVWAFGSNYYGQLGNGDTAKKDQYSPIQISGLTSVKAISAANWHSVALKTDGTVWTWGLNITGQLGDGTTNDKLVPTRVSTLSNITSIDARYDHSIAVRNDGALWAWGSNGKGQIGDGTKNTTNIVPKQISILDSVNSVSAGQTHSIVVKTDGTIWGWGYNYFGELGDGTRIDTLTPTKVNNVSGISSVTAAMDYNTSVNFDGSVWAWGLNSHNVLGKSSLQNSLVPLKLSYFNVGTKSLSRIPDPNTTNESEIPDMVDGLNKRMFDLSYTEQISGDTLPPTSPNNFEITSQNGPNIAISWDPSEDNYGVARYNIYSNDELIGTTKDETTLQLNLETGSSYLLSVKAVDEAGNESIASRSIWVTVE